MRASTSIPGVWPPALRKEGIFLDGGVLNNLPADLLVDLCSDGATIASDISAEVGETAYAQYPDAISGWRLLRVFV